MTQKTDKEYLAFISYQRKDEEFATWLQYQLEHFHVPINILEIQPELAMRKCRIFLDKTELSCGILGEEIEKALKESHYLIVLCSPSSAKSKWVDKEIRSFLKLNGRESVIPIIIAGTPFCQNPDEECFVPALKELKNTSDEILGINLAEFGREVTSIKVMAFMLGLKFDSLWQRYERDKEMEKQRLIEERNKLLRLQSLFLSEKSTAELANGNLATARLLALKALPENLAKPERPLVAEAEAALRKSMSSKEIVLRSNAIVRTAAISPSDDIVIFGGDNRTIQWWNISEGKMIHQLDKLSRIYSLHYSSDGTMIVRSTHRGDVIVSDKNGNPIRRFKNHGSPVFDAKLTPDMAHLIVTSSKGVIYIYDVQLARLLQRVEAHTDRITSVAISADARLIASSSCDSSIKIWDGSTAKLLKQYEFDGHRATSVSFDPCGRYILATDSGGHIKMIDIQTDKVKWENAIPEKGICCGTFSHNGEMVATGSNDGILRIMNSMSGMTEHIFNVHSDAINSIEFDRSDSIIVTSSSDKTVRIKQLRNMALPSIRKLEVHGNYITYNSSFNTITTISPSGTPVIYRLSDDSIVKLSSFGEKIQSISCSSVSNILTGLSIGNEIKIILWNMVTGLVQKVIRCGSTKSYSIRYYSDDDMPDDNNTADIDGIVRLSPNGGTIACSYGSTLELYSAVSGHRLHKFSGSNGKITAIDFSPSGDCIMAGSGNGILCIIDIRTGNNRNQINTGKCSINDAVYDNTGNRIAVTLNDKQTIIYDSSLNRIMMKIGHDWPANSVCFIHNGRQLIVGGKKTIIYDVTSGKRIEQFDEKYNAINCIISDDNTDSIYFASKSGLIGLINYPEEQQLSSIIDDARNKLKSFEISQEDAHRFYLDI